MEQNNGGMSVPLFGARLRALRRRAKWTQQAVADRLSIHRTTYTKYETGVVTPDQQGLLKLAEIFGVTVDYLLGREETAVRYVANDESKRIEVSLQEKVLLQMFRQLSPEEQKELVYQAQKKARERKTRR